MMRSLGRQYYGIFLVVGGAILIAALLAARLGRRALVVPAEEVEDAVHEQPLTLARRREPMLDGLPARRA